MGISKYLLTHQLRHSAAVFVYHQLDSDLFGSVHLADLGYPTPIFTSRFPSKGQRQNTSLFTHLTPLLHRKMQKNQLPLSRRGRLVFDEMLQNERTKILRLFPCLRIEQLQKPQLLFPSKR